MTVVNLVFTRSGCRKTITRYVGMKSHCPECRHYYNPTSIGWHRCTFGHGLQAWTIYQRVVLRLPYRIITQVTEHLFGVGLSRRVLGVRCLQGGERRGLADQHPGDQRTGDQANGSFGLI
jgi:hypothetical protein